MKPNRLKERLVAGEIPVGHMIVEFGTRGIAQILSNVDLDFVFIDTEHAAFSSADLADLLAWFKATSIAPIVRVPEVQYHFIARTLDAGALGVMVPDVTSGTQAQAIVSSAKYAPLGERGIMLNHAHTDYVAADPVEYTAYSNDNTTVICQIESVEGLSNLDGIASTPGVDILWVGHSDLTHSMGISGQFDHPDFVNALRRVIEVARSYGLAVGGQPGSLALAQEWISMGVNVISYSIDHAVYSQALRQSVTAVRQLAAEATP